MSAVVQTLAVPATDRRAGAGKRILRNAVDSPSDVDLILFPSFDCGFPSFFCTIFLILGSYSCRISLYCHWTTMPSNDYSHSNGSSIKNSTAAASAIASSTATSAVKIQLHLSSDLLNNTKQEIKLNGYGLSLGSVVAGGRYRSSVAIDESPVVVDRIEKSVLFLKSKLALSLYGVT